MKVLRNFSEIKNVPISIGEKKPKLTNMEKQFLIQDMQTNKEL